MANVNIKFNGKDYLLSCDDGQEESLKKLTSFLDNKYLELKSINIREKRRRKGELKRLREEIHQSTTTFTSTIYMSVI